MTQSTGGMKLKASDKTKSASKQKKNTKKKVGKKERSSKITEIRKQDSIQSEKKLTNKNTAEMNQSDEGEKSDIKPDKRKRKFKFASTDKSETVTTSDVKSVKRRKLEVDNGAELTSESIKDQQESKQAKKQRIFQHKKLRKRKAKLAKLKSKMPREELEKRLNRPKPDISPSQQALNYLALWNTEREQWKFNKKNQVWLLKNIYNESEINSANFKILLKYILDLKGKSKDETREEANKLLKDQASSDDNEIKYKRAVQVIQALDE